MNSKILQIDGSVLEGGGQILRMALAFSDICNIPVCISNIRKGRSQPGLRPQHLTGVKLMQQICNASVVGADMSSEQLTFSPNGIFGGKFCADTGTAGSVTLLLQVALPVCYFADKSVQLKLTGGTNCEMAPQIDYLTEVFRPNLEKFGATFDFDLIRRGYFPRGGGEIWVNLNTVHHFNAVDLMEQGQVTEVFGWSFVAGTLPVRLAHEMANSAAEIINRAMPDVNVNIERYKEDHKMAQGNCSGIILVCKTSTGCILGGSALGNRKETPNKTAVKAAEEILEALQNNACVDKHTQDMLIIFMALAKGKSSVKVGEITLHTKTAIHVAELITKAKFEVKSIDEKTNIIECIGIGYENQFQR